MQNRRVVVTGMGALTPVGNTVAEYWQGLLAGTSGAAPITRFDASKFKTRFACELKTSMCSTISTAKRQGVWILIPTMV